MEFRCICETLILIAYTVTFLKPVDSCMHYESEFIDAIIIIMKMVMKVILILIIIIIIIIIVIIIIIYIIIFLFS